MTARTTSMFALVLVLATSASARAQERTSEHYEVRHVYDEGEPLWEADADAWVELVAPGDLTVCRQGRVVVSGGGAREAHMGCWPRSTPSRLRVPSGPGYVGVRRGLEIAWLGDGAITLGDGVRLEIRVDDRLPFRIFGWSLAGASLVTAAALAIALAVNAIRGWEPILAMAAAGAAVFIGLGFAFFEDGLGLAVVPSDPAPPVPVD
ncbi:MAG TPA: hypothetical protein VL400_08220 [Polyangiaceae bacterium]|nr:hypothetical protein [Polyangiaceae bacterium]